MRSVRLCVVLASIVVMATLTGCSHLFTVKDNRDPVPAGWIVEYTVHLKNFLPIPMLTGVAAELPYGTVFVDAGEGGRRAGRRVLWQFNLAPGQTKDLHYRIRPYSTTRGIITTKVLVGDLSTLPFVWADEVREYTQVVAP